MHRESDKENQYWYNIFQEQLTQPKCSDLFMLEAVCYNPFPSIFKKILSFFEKYHLIKMLLRNHVAIEDRMILDIGCGGGRWSYFFAQRGGRVIGIDYADNIIGRNKQIFPWINFEKMDACNLRFSDNYFDMVSAFISLQHIPGSKKMSAFKEMIRVLKPGGYMIILEAVSSYRERIQNKCICSDLLTPVEWQKLFYEFDLAVVDNRYLHFFLIYGLYKYVKINLYKGIKNIKSLFSLVHKEDNQRFKIDNGRQNYANISLKYKLYDTIDRNFVRFIACISVPIEFIFIILSNLSKRFRGWQKIYLLQKKAKI